MNQLLNDKEINFIRVNVSSITKEKIAKILGVSVITVTRMIRKHGISAMDKDPNEQWKLLCSTNKLDYYISNKGQVGNIFRIIKPSLSLQGYFHVSIKINGKNKNIYNHKEVAKAFIPNPNNLSQVNHIDGNKLNNSVDNLEWCTASENQIHKVRMEHTKTQKITREIFDFIRSFDSDILITEIHKQVCLKYGDICYSSVRRVLNGGCKSF